MIKKYAIFVNNELLYSFDTIEPMLEWLRLNNLAIEFSISNPDDEPSTNLLPHFDFDEDWYGTVWQPKYPIFHGQEIYV